MPCYFFHLKLELYSSCSSSPVAQQAPRSAPRQDTNKATFLPRHDSDIFKTQLPAHKTTKWTSYQFQSKHDRQDSSEQNSGSVTPRSRPQSSAGRQEAHGDALLLPERNVALKKGSTSPALLPAKPSSEAASRDWRFGPVSIESIDMVSTSDEQAKEKAAKHGKGSNTGLHTKGVYLPSDPKTTHVGWGVVHLYRDTQETAALEQDGHGGKHMSAKEADGFSVDDCSTLCILAVPSWMMPSDLLGFVGDQTREDVSHFRLIRTGRANKYMVLMKFRSPRKARDWQKLWNGKLFSAMGPENCHVVFIKSVEFLTPSDASIQDPSAFPQNTNDPFTLSATQNKAQAQAQAQAHAANTTNPLTAKPRAPPTPSLIELPTCPVCLERMDETTGLLTILCQHVFHCACLEKWRGSGCPVCRYTQSPSFTFPFPRPDNHHHDTAAIEPTCSVCSTASNLWICLICGNTACGRYDDAHAYAHYEDTSHCYAMDITTQHVWDYAGDGYVHRLIQNKPDSHPIHLPSNPANRNTAGTRHPNAAFREELTDGREDMVPREKMEGMAEEYTYLLTSQLEGQRRYYEEQLERAVDKASSASAKAEEASASASRATESITALAAQNKDLAESVTRLEKALEKSDTRAARFEKMARDMGDKWREEKMLNEGLVGRIHVAEKTAKEKAEEVVKMREEKAELEDMNRDLTIFISSQEKVRELQAQGEEVEMGSATVPEQQQQKKKGKGKKK